MLQANQIYKEFLDKVNKFVSVTLVNYNPDEYYKNKVIHDPVWGTALLYKWELQILDSPLMQRLRNIKQLGLAMLTYPSANHSRFEHTIGVMCVVTKIVNHINQEHAVIAPNEHYILRLAALLHDIGHCFYSHLSESIYGNTNEFVKLKKSVKMFESAKEHEIFSYLIINSDEFKEFVKKIELWEKDIDCDDLLGKIGKMIVGETLPVEENIKKYYMTQIINGQYDADKLDYLRRDSYNAGLSLAYDIDRFLYKIRIEDRFEDGAADVIGKHLVIPISGISAIEEMAFSQLMLASYIYQHQKVLVSDVLIKDIVTGLIANGKLKHPCDFLYYCDNDIFGIYNMNPDPDFKMAISDQTFSGESKKTLSDIVMKIKNRDLPKRAFFINNTVLKGKQYLMADIADRLRSIKELRKDIQKEAAEISNALPEEFRVSVDLYDIYISIPKTSIAKDLSNALVIDNTKNFVCLSDIIRLSDWADAFAWHKWNAYIFANSEILHVVSLASKIVLEKNGLQFNDNVFLAINDGGKIKQIINYLKSDKNSKYYKYFNKEI